ncbi:hypothetical protein ACWD2L_06165 [Streptomyces sp. NPDC002754]
MAILVVTDDTFEIDDEDISDLVVAYQIEHRAGEVPRLSLELLADDTRIRINGKTLKEMFTRD